MIQTLGADAPLSTANRAMVSPDEKTIYFLMKEGDQEYLYKAPINQSQTKTASNHLGTLEQFASANLPYNTSDYNIYWDENMKRIIITPDIGIGDGSFQSHLAASWDDYQTKALAAIAWIKAGMYPKIQTQYST